MSQVPERSAREDHNAPKAAPKKRDAVSRIKFALLDEYSMAAEGNGGDPYNTKNGKKQDLWRGNLRRL